MVRRFRTGLPLSFPFLCLNETLPSRPGHVCTNYHANVRKSECVWSKWNHIQRLPGKSYYLLKLKKNEANAGIRTFTVGKGPNCRRRFQETNPELLYACFVYPCQTSDDFFVLVFSSPKNWDPKYPESPRKKNEFFVCRKERKILKMGIWRFRYRVGRESWNMPGLCQISASISQKRWSFGFQKNLGRYYMLEPTCIPDTQRENTNGVVTIQSITGGHSK